MLSVDKTYLQQLGKKYHRVAREYRTSGTSPLPETASTLPCSKSGEHWLKRGQFDPEGHFIVGEAANEVAGATFALLPPFLRVSLLHIYHEGILFNEMCDETALNSLTGIWLPLWPHEGESVQEIRSWWEISLGNVHLWSCQWAALDKLLALQH